MRTLSRRFVAASILLAFTTLAANAKPNFTGSWKLNTSSSDFGPMPAPDSMSSTITHEEPNLKIAVKQIGQMGEFAWETKYTTDGKESNNVVRENPSTSIVKWDGDLLTFDTKGKFGDNEFTMKDKWTLSEDGKKITMERTFSSSMGEAAQKLIFEKQ